MANIVWTCWTTLGKAKIRLSERRYNQTQSASHRADVLPIFALMRAFISMVSLCEQCCSLVSGLEASWRKNNMFEFSLNDEPEEWIMELFPQNIFFFFADGQISSYFWDENAAPDSGPCPSKPNGSLPLLHLWRPTSKQFWRGMSCPHCWNLGEEQEKRIGKRKERRTETMHSPMLTKSIDRRSSPSSPMSSTKGHYLELTWFQNIF